MELQKKLKIARNLIVSHCPAQDWWLNRRWQPLSQNSSMVLRRRMREKVSCSGLATARVLQGGAP
jgi:hypothetical protein